MSVTEAAGVVSGLTVPTGSALVIAVMITIVVVTRSTLIVGLRSSLSFDLPFAGAAVRDPQAVLADAPSAILHACTVHAQWIGVSERSAALAKDRTRSLARRAAAMSIGETAGVVCRRPIPTRALMVAIMIAVVIVILSTLISPVILTDDEIRAAALVYPDSIAMSTPGAALNAGLLAILPHYSKVVWVAVSRDFTFLMLTVRRTVEPLRAGRDASENQCNRYQQ